MVGFFLSISSQKSEILQMAVAKDYYSQKDFV